MCGFCGVLGPAGRAGVEDVPVMARTLAHRGPDDSGYWRGSFRDGSEEFEVGLGHTRLSILDLSPAGHQPMHDGDGRTTVSYNGEIYNFRELRAELEGCGARFRSECDTEVLLEAYRAWGLDAFDRLNGMFAFALWDAPARRLVLVRDRLGIKPLYWRFDEGVLSFASELRALRPHRNFRGEVDRVALARFLQHGFVPGPRTIYAGVHKLMPGEVLVWERGEVRTFPFFRLTDPPSAEIRDFDAAVDRLEDLLGDAVEQRLVADVPLGAFLSGGVDSSTVVALMARRARGRVRTFSIGFPEEGFDESPHARAVARHLKTDHMELMVDRRRALDVVDELPELYDEPFADESAIPTTLLSRMTREHVTVALSGDGGDELFGGYDQYPKLRRLLPFLGLPTPLRAGLRGAAALLPRGPLRSGLLHLRSGDPAEVAFRLLAACEPETLEAICGPGTADPNPVYLGTFRAAPMEDPVRRAMLADARVYLPDDILTKVDRASMSVALEARVPLLDVRVVRFAFSLPLEILWHGGQTKAPLRAVLHRHVPRELVERPKHGFSFPLLALLEEPLRAWRERLLDPRRLREEGFLRPEGVERILAQARRRAGVASQATMLWRLVCFQRWLARHHHGKKEA